MSFQQLSKEEKEKELELIKELREYVLTTQKENIAKENSTMPKRIIYRLKAKLKLDKTMEKRTFALCNFKVVKKYLTNKHKLEGQSITMSMIDEETLKSLINGTKSYIIAQNKIKAFTEEKPLVKHSQRH